MKFILLIVLFILVATFISTVIDSKKKYRNFVTFLKKNSDTLTLDKIGATFLGKETKNQNRVLPHVMDEQLTKMYELTKKEKYREYLEYVQSTRKSVVFLFIAMIVLTFILINMFF